MQSWGQDELTRACSCLSMLQTNYSFGGAFAPTPALVGSQPQQVGNTCSRSTIDCKTSPPHLLHRSNACPQHSRLHAQLLRQPTAFISQCFSDQAGNNPLNSPASQTPPTQSHEYPIHHPTLPAPSEQRVSPAPQASCTSSQTLRPHTKFSIKTGTTH
jgi:hypothetical protein